MKLMDYLEQEGIGIKAFAFYNSIDEKTVHNWIKGRCIPMKIYQSLIEKATGGKVTEKDWKNGQKKADNRKRSPKDNGMHSTQHMDADKAAKPKVSNTRR